MRRSLKKSRSNYKLWFLNRNDSSTSCSKLYFDGASARRQTWYEKIVNLNLRLAVTNHHMAAYTTRAMVVQCDWPYKIANCH